MRNDNAMLFKKQIKEEIINKLMEFSIKLNKNILIAKRLSDRYLEKLNLYELKSNIYQITNFLPNNRNFHERIICILNDIDQCKKCNYCENFCKLKYNSDLKKYTYTDFCSIQCINKSTITKEKIKQTNLKIYGCENTLQSEIVKAKCRATNLKLYGVENIFQSKQVQDKHKENLKIKYGVENISQIESVKEKKKQKSIEKFGTENVLQSKIVKAKSKTTCLERYGVENPNQCKDIIERGTLIKRTNFFNILKNNQLLNSVVKFKFDLEEYLQNTSRRKKFKFECVKCNTEFIYRLTNTNLPICPKCNPKNKRSSVAERELFNYVKTLCDDVLPNQTNIIGKRNEIDIYIPSKQIGIEFNGLYWHGEFSKGRKQLYHLNKTVSALNLNITLLHFFEDEYKDNKILVHRIIKEKIGIYDKIINLSQCKFEPISEYKFLKFVNENSFLFIDSKYEKYIGIKWKNKLVGCYSTNDDIFIDNLVILSEYDIINLIDKFSNNKLIVDMRFGCKYLTSDFKVINTTHPIAFYIQKSKRLKSEKIDIEHYDNELPFELNLQLNKIDRIYDCGKFIYSK